MVSFKLVPFLMLLFITVDANYPNNSSDPGMLKCEYGGLQEIQDPKIDYQGPNTRTPPAVPDTPTKRRFIYAATYVDYHFYTFVCQSSMDCVDLRMFDIIQRTRELFLLIDVEFREVRREVWKSEDVPIQVNSRTYTQVLNDFGVWLDVTLRVRRRNEADVSILLTGKHLRDGDKFAYGLARGNRMCQDSYNTLIVRKCFCM